MMKSWMRLYRWVKRYEVVGHGPGAIVRVGKYKSLYALEASVSLLIDAGEFDQPLRLIHDFVECIFTEPMCTDQVTGSRALDNLCQRIGSENLAAIDRSSLVADSRPEQHVFVYIVTRLQESGGHKRVIEDFIKARPLARHVVLSTELSGRSDAGYLIKGLAEKVDITFESAQRHDNYRQRLTWLQQRLLEICATKVYLFNHHQDSVAVAAVQPGMGIDASFYHHADHHLCLGACLPQIEHIDPHPMGYHNCRKELGIDNTYVPLTIDDRGDRPHDWPFMPDGTLTTCTAARSNKIEISYFVSYLDVVPELLSVTGGRHVHIGRLTPWALFRIRRGLKRLGIPSDRFVYIPWVSSVWKALYEHHVDLYIASFPYGGGLTLIEAMGAGVPVALHHHVFSRVLSSIDLAYPEAFSWRLPAELLNYCANVTPETLQQHGRLARAQYLSFHSQQILTGILATENSKAISPPDLCDRFHPQQDEFVAWVENEVSVGHVVRRMLYRCARKLRSNFS